MQNIQHPPCGVTCKRGSVTHSPCLVSLLQLLIAICMLGRVYTSWAFYQGIAAGQSPRAELGIMLPYAHNAPQELLKGLGQRQLLWNQQVKDLVEHRKELKSRAVLWVIK